MHTFRTSAIQVLMEIANKKVDIVVAAVETFDGALLKERTKDPWRTVLVL